MVMLAQSNIFFHCCKIISRGKPYYILIIFICHPKFMQMGENETQCSAD